MYCRGEANRNTNPRQKSCDFCERVVHHAGIYVCRLVECNVCEYISKRKEVTFQFDENTDDENSDIEEEQSPIPRRMKWLRGQVQKLSTKITNTPVPVPVVPVPVVTVPVPVPVLKRKRGTKKV